MAEFVVKSACVESYRRCRRAPFPPSLPSSVSLRPAPGPARLPALPPGLPSLSRGCPAWLGFVRSHLGLSGPAGASLALLQPWLHSLCTEPGNNLASLSTKTPPKHHQPAKTCRLFSSCLPVTSPWLLLNSSVLLLCAGTCRHSKVLVLGWVVEARLHPQSFPHPHLSFPPFLSLRHTAC